MLQGAERAKLDQVQEENEVWAPISTLPAKCLWKCPKENYFRILKFFLVGCIHILSGAFWWWWWSKWSWYAKSHFAYDLDYVRKFQLCLLPI
jgi:hypothetical protein